MGTQMACCCASADERKEDNNTLKNEIKENKISITSHKLGAKHEKGKELSQTVEVDAMKEIDHDGTVKDQQISARGPQAEFPKMSSNELESELISSTTPQPEEPQDQENQVRISQLYSILWQLKTSIYFMLNLESNFCSTTISRLRLSQLKIYKKRLSRLRQCKRQMTKKARLQMK